MKRSCFPKEERLCSAVYIRKLLKCGSRYHCSGAKLFVLPNALPYSRFGCTFCRHYGSAVQRNKARRFSKEVYRQMKHQIVCGFDILVLIFPGNDTFIKRQQQLECLLRKARVLIVEA